MKISAPDLHRMAYNAIQFSHKDSSFGGLTLWSAGMELLRCWASDDYVALRDECSVDTSGGGELLWGLELKHLKEMEKELRDREGEISFTVDGQLSFLSASDFPVVDATEAMTPVVKIIFDSKPTGSLGNSPFAIRQDRFTKFRLLKTPGEKEYPVDFIHGTNDVGVGVLLWKLGPTLRGVVGQVDRGYLHEYFAGEEVLWD